MSPQTARARKKTSGGTNLKMFYIVLGLVAVLGIGAIVVTTTKSATIAKVPIELAPELLQNTQQLVTMAKGIEAGPDSARVKILVFSDFTCPACGVFATKVEPSLRPEFIETGKIQLVYYDFPLGGAGQHAHGFLAARAARCANDQGKFWPLHDLLFARQQEWSYSKTAPVELLQKYATEVGLDAGPFEKCLKSDQHADVVSISRALGEKLGVGSTPTVFMNSRQVQEWNDFEAIKRMIQQVTG